MIFACIGAQGVGKSEVIKELRNMGYISSDGLSRPLIRAGLYESMEKEKFQVLLNDLTISHHTPFLHLNYPVFFTRSILDCIAYGIVNKLDREKKWLKEGLEWYEKNRDNYRFIYFPIEFEIKEDKERVADKQYQKEVDEECVNILRETNTYFLSVSGSVEDRVESILRYVDISLERNK